MPPWSAACWRSRCWTRCPWWARSPATRSISTCYWSARTSPASSCAVMRLTSRRSTSGEGRGTPLTRGIRIQERALAQLLEGPLQLLLGVHHDRSVPGDGFRQRLAGHQQEADPLVAGLHRDLVAAVEEHEGAVVRLGGRRGVQPAHPLG